MRSLAVIVSLFGVSLLGCASDQLQGTLPANRPPVVWLGIAPPEGSVVSYRVHIFWDGTDPDGDVAFFEYVITDNETGTFNPADTTGADKWSRISAKDSIFIFSADVVADSSVTNRDDMEAYEFKRTHTFFVRAVDDRGLRSAPVYRSFTARNLSPIISIFVPNITGLNVAMVPPIMTFRWAATDPIVSRENTQDPDSVRSILVNTSTTPIVGFEGAARYIRENPDAVEWGKWVAYNAPGDSGRFWHPKRPVPFGSYVFAVQAKDEAGAVTPVFDPAHNLKRIRVLDRRTGPVLILSNKFLGRIVTSSPDPTPAVLDLPSGVPLSFRWTADASGYGGVTTGYRYGWDMIDLNDDDEWTIDLTPFVGSGAQAPTRTFFFGTHTFFVEVVDNSGFKSRAGVVINIIPFTMERDVLVIDDWDEGTSPGFSLTRGALPADSEHDAFWADVMSILPGFRPGVDMFPFPLHAPLTSPPPIGVLARYKAIIWNSRGSPTFSPLAILRDMAKFGSTELNLISLYMAAGGKVLICGNNVMTNLLDKNLFPYEGSRFGQPPRYPLIFRYESGGDQGGAGDPVADDSFAYLECCLNVVDVAYGTSARRRSFSCPVGELRDFNARTDGLRACNSIDGTYAFPRLELRAKVAGPSKFYREDQLGLNCDIYNPAYFGASCSRAESVPPRGCFAPMYGLECLNTSSRVFGEPVAYWTSQFAHVPNPDGVAARSAVWGFEPVYFKPEQIKRALEIIFFDEWRLQR